MVARLLPRSRSRVRIASPAPHFTSITSITCRPAPGDPKLPHKRASISPPCGTRIDSRAADRSPSSAFLPASLPEKLIGPFRTAASPPPALRSRSGCRWGRSCRPHGTCPRPGSSSTPLTRPSASMLQLDVHGRRDRRCRSTCRRSSPIGRGRKLAREGIAELPESYPSRGFRSGRRYPLERASRSPAA